jgi:hypothetical protein
MLFQNRMLQPYYRLLLKQQNYVGMVFNQGMTTLMFRQVDK